MITIAICDDQAADRNILKKSVELCLDRRGIVYEIYDYQNGHDLLADKSLKNFDIIFLDVHMPGIDGIDLGREIRTQNKKSKIVYVTGYKDYAEYAIDATHCFFYLTKPISDNLIKEKMAVILEYLKEEQIKIGLKTKNGYQYFSPDEIYYFEHANRVINAYTTLGEFEISATLNEIEAKVIKCGFAMPHRAFLVNLMKIRGIHGYTILLTNGKEIELSQRKAVKFKENYNEYMQKFLV